MLSKKPVLIILSIMTAMFMWVYVTGNVDPETKSKVNHIEVNLTNTDELANQGLAVANGEDLTTGVIITGKRSIVNKVKSNRFTATVDVGKAKKGENQLPVEFETPAGVSIDDSTEATVTVNVEDRIRKSVPVKIVFKDKKDSVREPWATEVWPNNITVYGAESVVKRVAEINADIESRNVETAAKNVKADVFAVDTSGTEIKGLAYDKEYVMATVQLLERKEVKVNVKGKNLDSKYRVDKVSGIDTVTILGTQSVLKKINSIDVYADLSDIESGGLATVSVTPELPYGVYLPGELKSKAKITIKVAD